MALILDYLFSNFLSVMALILDIEGLLAVNLSEDNQSWNILSLPQLDEITDE
jgi:hypothetical protein